MKQIFLSLILGLGLLSCAEDITLSTGDLSGSVSDQTTGEPVAVVDVTLRPGGRSTVTGSDGSFHFAELEAGSYTVEISKEGYKSNTKTIAVTVGYTAEAHLLIERIPAIVTADRDILNFGNDSGVNTLSFSIVNSTYEDLAWEIAENCEWITSVTPASGTLGYGKTETIVVVIDRAKLAQGANTSVIVIRSSNGGTEVTVVARNGVSETDEYMVLEGAGIMVLKQDLYSQALDWGDAEELCTDCRIGGYSDWRLPTKSELLTLYKEKDNIGGFEQYSSYWTSTYSHSGMYGSRYYNIVNFATGNVSTAEYIMNTTHRVRAVRSLSVPQVETQDVSDIRPSSATFKGKIITAADYTERGFVYATEQNPTIENCMEKLVAISTTDSAYSCKATNLILGQSYYVRAYAMNSDGVAYGNEIAFVTAEAFPQVSTGEATDIDIANGIASLHGTVTYEGEPAYIERGFVWSTQPDPTINDNVIVANGTGVGAYSVYTENLPKAKTYYVRAYAKSEFGVAYGKNVAVSDEWVVLPAAGIAVQTKDLGYVSWSSAKSLCESSIVGGYTDWRLPSRDELMTIYSNRELIGNFINEVYWTSYYSSSSYYYVQFYSGEIGKTNSSSKYKGHVRAVRTLTNE